MPAWDGERIQMNKILVVEDDPRIQKTLERLFLAEGFEIHGITDGRLAMECLQIDQPAAVILDLRLPGVSGRDLCRSIKAFSNETPVIILSAISEVADKVLLLEMGADDYVTKPFSPRELLARVQAAIRRSRRTVRPGVAFFGEISVDFQRMEVQRKGKPVMMTAQEFKLLRFFISNPGRVLSREELLNDVWGYNFYPSTRAVDNQILKLRQKLEPDPVNPRYFRTVHGIGYKFVSEERETAGAETKKDS